MESRCDTCLYNTYDEYVGDYVCDMNMDEDEAYRIQSMGTKHCPYYIDGDEYKTVRHQI